MLSTLRNAWKVPELRKRLLFLIFATIIYRFGNTIPVSGVHPENIAGSVKSGTLFGFYDLISGGAFARSSIFAVGVMPYINASIIMQLLTIAIPQLEQLSKEGEDGRKKIQKYTRYLSIPLAVFLALSQYALFRHWGSVTDKSKLTLLVIIFTLTVGSTFLMWLGDIITQYGIGNGISLLIFINIMSRFPSQVSGVIKTKELGVDIVKIITVLIIIVAMFLSVIVSTLAERRIPVQYAGKTVGNRTYKGQSTHIPININNSGVIAIIFAMSVLQFPSNLAKLKPSSSISKWIDTSKYSVFKSDSYLYCVTFLLLIIFFTWFYTQITFKPDEMAENMHKSSGFIPGIRPGEPTERYLEKVLGRISLLGGLFAGMLAVVPVVIGIKVSQFQSIQFGGTSLLIMVSVALETMKQIESQLVMRHYKGFLK